MGDFPCGEGGCEMKIVRTGLFAALAIAAAAFGFGERHPAPDPMVVSAIAPAAEERFSLQAGGRDGGCLVSAIASDEARRPLSLGSTCLDLVPGLAGARWWFEREDGSVAFLTDDGRVAAEFAIADGAAFESYAPRQPIMTLLSR